MTAPAPFSFALRIYWEDTDAGGVVFYANYLKFFERARTEWLRSLGFSQERLRLDTGVMFVVTDTSVRYRSPARLDDVLDVNVRITHTGAASMALAQQAHRGERLLAEGNIAIACVDALSFRPRRFPNDLLSAIT